mmetsp:Transcript_12628/g.58381  ORF Transcript_12628/g.58381 Transcript_12628/m.58381 type:complete len:333 (+) Transcript_12628:288-1286(+)
MVRESPAKTLFALSLFLLLGTCQGKGGGGGTKGGQTGGAGRSGGNAMAVAKYGSLGAASAVATTMTLHSASRGVPENGAGQGATIFDFVESHVYNESICAASHLQKREILGGIGSCNLVNSSGLSYYAYNMNSSHIWKKHYIDAQCTKLDASPVEVMAIEECETAGSESRLWVAYKTNTTVQTYVQFHSTDGSCTGGTRTTMDIPTEFCKVWKPDPGAGTVYSEKNAITGTACSNTMNCKPSAFVTFRYESADCAGPAKPTYTVDLLHSEYSAGICSTFTGSYDFIVVIHRPHLATSDSMGMHKSKGLAKMSALLSLGFALFGLPITNYPQS